MMRINPLHTNVALGQSPGATRGTQHATSSFAHVLEKQRTAESSIRFSGHAQQRLNDRNIVLTDHDIARIAQSTDDAMAKGSKESLLLMDDIALVVGVPKRTVITVMDAHERQNTVFTHIDSVIVMAKDVPSPNKS